MILFSQGVLSPVEFLYISVDKECVISQRMQHNIFRTDIDSFQSQILHFMFYIWRDMRRRPEFMHLVLGDSCIGFDKTHFVFFIIKCLLA